MHSLPHFFDLDPEQLADWLESWGLKRFRAGQVMGWVYERGVIDPAEMTDLPRRDREVLAERMRFLDGVPVQHQAASDGTRKLLLEWGHGRPSTRDAAESLGSDSALSRLGGGDDAKPPPARTECVMIPAISRDSGRSRSTACISSQVGCPVGCRFCASGLGGLELNLTAGRIVEQVWQLQQLEEGERITHIVFMGMGEPLANFGPVTRVIRTLMASWGMGLSGRRITLSTVGLPAPIRRLADLDLPITLAISLHAPNDEVRKQLIPWAERVSVDQLIEAGRYYFHRTGREVTLEHILIGGVNDRPDHARELAGVAQRLRANINLIRYNEVAGLGYDRPRHADVRQFQRILRDRGINTHLRASRGRDIAAACGQLRYQQRARPEAHGLQSMGVRDHSSRISTV